MNKMLKIDFSSDRLTAVAADMVDNHNYIGALKMLNKNAELNGNDEFTYMLYAEIFDDISLYEKCINCWFRYIDCSHGADLTEAYEGLAVAYMNLNEEHFSAYYYNKLLMDTEEFDAEMREDIMKSFLSREQNPLKFVYPPKIADCSDLISEGVENMKDGDYDKAIDAFEQVEEGNEAYLSARNYVAMCKIICDRCDEAEEECNNILKRHPDNIQALTTLAAVRTEQKKVKESRELAKKLLTLNVTKGEELFKIATVCCENKMHEEAYGLFCKLEDELEYDSSVLYFKAVSAYNCGKVEESFSAFDKLLTVYPHAVTARYHYEKAREAVENGKELELSYFYRMPHSERESNLKMLAVFANLPEASARKFIKLADISDSIYWCFDENEGDANGELQFLGAHCAIRSGNDNIVGSILLNAFLPDGLKVKTLTVLGERNKDDCVGVVICHLYKQVSFRALNLGRLKRKNFISAYARLTAHFAIIDDSYGDMFAEATQAAYERLEAVGKLSLASDVDALTAAIYKRSNIPEQLVASENLSDFFGATDKKINAILGEL